MVSGNDLQNIKNQRSKPYIYKVVQPELLAGHEQLGWTLDKTLKKSVKIRKEKPIDEAFEDRVWVLFAKMGFQHMNKDRHLEIPYVKENPDLTQQIDVLAIDEDTAIVVECKAAQSLDKKTNFKDTITAIQGYRQGLTTAIKKKYNKRKVAYIFATQNYVLGDQDLARLQESKITYFDEDVLKYYEELVKQLGDCAKYQLQGHLFMNTKIENMQTVVPAVMGDMGGHPYYAFSCKPDTLLKMCHVLHRDKVNKDNMPAYQRFVKHDRLLTIRRFIDNGGYFPNSIVINIENTKKLRFDKSDKQCEDGPKLGLLTLPQLYHSAYIIDGQHRLYGYAGTEYATKNTIPVVAFVGLKPEEQVELFMQINENQKAVPKRLRNVLNATLLLDSDDPSSVRKALCLSIAQALGEDRASPLFGAVNIDENDNNTFASVTMEAISDGIRKGQYLSTFKKKGNVYNQTSHGLFDKDDNAQTRAILYPFLRDCFNYLQECLEDEWKKGKSGVILINNSIQAIIMLLHDIVSLLQSKGKVNPMSDKVATIIDETKYYLDPLISFIHGLTTEQRDTIKKSYGSTGPTKVWRTYQKAIADKRPDFCPEGLEEWWRDNAKQFNNQSGTLIRDISKFIKDDFEKRLRDKYGNDWFTNGVPKPVYMKASKTATERNYGVTDDAQRITPWQCVTISQCQQIATYGSNWSEVFCDAYTMPNTKGTKIEKTDWMIQFDKIRAKDLFTYSVTEKEYKFLQEIFEWLTTP